MRCTRTWNDWHVFLQTEEQKLALKYPAWKTVAKAGDAADAFRALHAATETEVLTAIFEFAESGNWVELSPEAGAMLLLRVSRITTFSKDFAKMPLRLRQPHEKRTEEEWIRHFFWESWDEIFFGAILRELISQRPPGVPAEPIHYRHF